MSTLEVRWTLHACPSWTPHHAMVWHTVCMAACPGTAWYAKQTTSALHTYMLIFIPVEILCTRRACALTNLLSSLLRFLHSKGHTLQHLKQFAVVFAPLLNPDITPEEFERAFGSTLSTLSKKEQEAPLQVQLQLRFTHKCR